MQERIEPELIAQLYKISALSPSSYSVRLESTNIVDKNFPGKEQHASLPAFHSLFPPLLSLSLSRKSSHPLSNNSNSHTLERVVKKDM